MSVKASAVAKVSDSGRYSDGKCTGTEACDWVDVVCVGVYGCLGGKCCAVEW